MKKLITIFAFAIATQQVYGQRDTSFGTWYMEAPGIITCSNGEIRIEGDTMKVLKNLMNKYDILRQNSYDAKHLIETFSMHFLIYDFLKDSKNFKDRDYFYREWLKSKKVIDSWYKR